MKVYNCLHCQKENKWGRSKTNKYCDNVCQGMFKWVNETVGRIERGEVSDGSPALKKYLIEKFGEKCSECGQESSWNNKPLVLQLDHIDGDSDNNFPSNIRMLCPNCHSQTENFGSKGKGSRYKKITKRNKYLQSYKSLGA
jgi:endogenous inhibitor of DNA gyrase (YacG/DUF329 family)